MSAEAGTAPARFGDPLSEVTRAERKTLLLVSAIGIVMELTGLVPSKITTFGVEFSEADQNLLLGLFGGVVIYFLVAFLVYAWSDFLAWNATVRVRRSKPSLQKSSRTRSWILRCVRLRRGRCACTSVAQAGGPRKDGVVTTR